MIRWTLFRNRTDAASDSCAAAGEWEHLVGALSVFRTAATKDGPAWAPARFLLFAEAIALGDPKERLISGGEGWEEGKVRRRKMNVVEVTALVVDIDVGGRAARDSILLRLREKGIAYHWHTTFSGPEKFRVVIPISEPVPRAKWHDFWHWATRAVGGNVNPVDTQCKDSSRLYYLPAIDSQGTWEGECGTAEGRPLDVAGILSKGPWPVSEGAARDSGERKAYPKATTGQLWVAEQALEKHGDAVEGQHGDARTYVAASILINDFALTPDEAWPLLASWNVKHARPIWGELSLREKLNNALEYASTPYGARRDELTPWRAEYERALHGLSQRRPDSEAGPRVWPTLEEIEGTDYGPTPWTISEILAHDSLFCLSGDPKASKTWALLEMAIAIASDTPFLGKFHIKRPGASALFLNEDTADAVKTRAAALWRGRRGSTQYDRKLVRVISRSELDLGNQRQVAALIADVRSMNPRPVLLGLDPLRNLHTSEENDSTEMSTVMRTLRAVRDLCACAVVFVHHSNKKSAGDTRSGGNRLRGSSAVYGAIDGLLSFEETVNEPGEISNVTVTVTKHGKGAGTFRLALSINDDDQGRATHATWVKTDLEKSEKPDKRRGDGLTGCARWVLLAIGTAQLQAIKAGAAYVPRGHWTWAHAAAAVVHVRRDLAYEAIQNLIEAGRLVTVPVTPKREGIQLAPDELEARQAK